MRCRPCDESYSPTRAKPPHAATAISPFHQFANAFPSRATWFDCLLGAQAKQATRLLVEQCRWAPLSTPAARPWPNATLLNTWLGRKCNEPRQSPTSAAYGEASELPAGCCCRRPPAASDRHVPPPHPPRAYNLALPPPPEGSSSAAAPSQSYSLKLASALVAVLVHVYAQVHEVVGDAGAQSQVAGRIVAGGVLAALVAHQQLLLVRAPGGGRGGRGGEGVRRMGWRWWQWRQQPTEGHNRRSKCCSARPASQPAKAWQQQRGNSVAAGKRGACAVVMCGAAAVREPCCWGHAATHNHGLPSVEACPTTSPQE